MLDRRRGRRPGLHQRPPRALVPRGHARRGARGGRRLRAGAARRAAARERRVRLGQPDRPADGRQRARRVRRRPALPRARGRRPSRHARVLLQRLGHAGAGARRIGRGAAAGRGAARGGVPRRVRRRPRARTCPTTSGPRRPRRTPIATAILGAWASEGVRAGIEASLERLGVHFDVWKSETSLHDDGWVARGVERLREAGHVYEAGRRDLVPLDDVRRRQGPRHLPLDGRADLLRLRHRLRRPRSSAAASTSSSTSGAPTTTAPSRGSATRPRRWASTARRSRCSSSPGCASCATATRCR